jgi:hypothetical protein
MRDRFFYIVARCINEGIPVTATTLTGDKYQGPLHTFTKEGVVLKEARKVGEDRRQPEVSLGDFITLEFHLNDKRDEQAAKFKSDAEIARNKAPGRRELQKYAPEAPVLLSLEQQQGQSKFDQFEANEKLFGMTATFDEDQYTTPLVRPEDLTEEQRHRSEEVLRALEKTQTQDDTGADAEDEERFAAVKGTGRFSVETAPERHSLTLDQRTYRQLREDMLTGKRIQHGLVKNPERIEALLLEPVPFRNEEIADDLKRFKEEKAVKEDIKRTLMELKEFKRNFEERVTTRQESVEELAEIPASLLDLYLDSLQPSTEQECAWPAPSEHRAQTMPPRPILNPHAPEFSSQLM